MVHGALVVPQVLRLIFQHLGPFFTPTVSEVFESTDPEKHALPKLSHSKSSLLNAALTCKSFKDPALDVLWWAMDDLEPLFLLLDHEEIAREARPPIKVIRQPLVKSEIQAFVTYANRVKLFILRGSSKIHPSSYIQVLQAIERMSIFPSLKYLLSTGSFPELHLLATHCLLGFYGYSAGNPADEPSPIDLWTFVRGLPANSNKLQFLKLEYPVAKSCLNAIAQLPELQTLSINDSSGTSSALGSAFFTALSARPKIMKLNIVTKGAFGNMVIATTSAFSCNVLTDLTLLCMEDESGLMEARVGMQEIFRVIKFPRLEKLRISYPVVDKADLAAWRLLFKSLVTATPMLHSLLLKTPYRHNPTAVTTRKKISLNHISRLSKLSLMIFEDDNFFSSWSLNDCTFVVESWPNLIILSIATTLTFPMLTVLVSGLPSLYCLKVALSSKKLPGVEEIPVLPHSPIFINIHPTSPAPDDPIHFGACLDKLCPSTETWMLPQLAQLDPRGAWKQTGRILQALRSARIDSLTQEHRPTNLKQLKVAYSKDAQNNDI